MSSVFCRLQCIITWPQTDYLKHTQSLDLYSKKGIAYNVSISRMVWAVNQTYLSQLHPLLFSSHSHSMHSHNWVWINCCFFFVLTDNYFPAKNCLPFDKRFWIKTKLEKSCKIGNYTIREILKSYSRNMDTALSSWSREWTLNKWFMMSWRQNVEKHRPSLKAPHVPLISNDNKPLPHVIFQHPSIDPKCLTDYWINIYTHNKRDSPHDSSTIMVDLTY